MNQIQRQSNRPQALLMLILMGLTSVGCQSSTGRGAAYALGGLALTGIGLELLTQSSVCVDVDVYNETIPCKNWYGSVIRQPDTFRLGGPAAIKKAMSCQVDPVQYPTAEAMNDVHQRVAEQIDEIRQMKSGLDRFNTGIKKFNIHGNTDWKAVSDDSDRLTVLRQTVLSDWVKFDELWRKSSGNPKFSDKKLKEQANILAQLRDSARELEAFEFSSTTLNYIKKTVESAFEKKDFNLGPLRSNPEISQFLTQAQQELLDTDESKRSAIASSICNELQSFGFFIEPADLLEQGDEASLQAKIEEHSIVGQLKAVGRAIRMLTYSALSGDFNYGPIKNEVMQQVLTCKEIDELLDPDNSWRWHRMQSASSSGGMGNHNTVIYLENWATPFLKSSAFDPTDFVVAHGVMYRKAFNTAAAVFGLPLPDLKTGATATTSDYNLYSLKGQQIDSQTARIEEEKRLLNTLRALIDAQVMIKDAQSQGDTEGKKWDSTAKAEALENVAKLLENLAERLDPTPETTKAQ